MNKPEFVYTIFIKTTPSISVGWPLVLSSPKSILETGKPLAFDPAKTTT